LHQKEGQEKQDKRSLTLENIRKNLEELSKKRTKGFDGLRGKSEKTASGKLELNQLLYKTILETIWTDVSCMIEFQKKIMARKKAALGVPDSVAEQLEKEIKQKFWEKINLEFAPPSEEEEYDRNRLIYNSIVEAVLVDGDITEKKKLYLKKKREELNISDEDAELPEIEVAHEAKISVPSTEDIIEPPEIKPRERSGRIEVKKTEPEARLIAKEEFQRRAKEDLRKAAEEERKKELRLTWMEREGALANKEGSVSEVEESERELIRTEEAKKETMRRKWMAEEKALAKEDVPAPESSAEEMAGLTEEEFARQAEEEESKRLEEEKRLAEEFAKKAEEELARAEEEEARLEEEAKKEAMRRKWMAEEEALATENETGEVAPREIEEEMERLAEEEELKRIEEEKRLAEEFAKQAEEELAKAEEEARLAAEEEARKEALRQKWMAEEEALATDAPGEEVSQKSGEEARKEAMRRKWMAEEEALATEDVSGAESSEEEMARLAEEEFARQAEEELARAEEEARLAEEEEARKEALRQKWMAEEALATEDVPGSESSEEEMARLAEEEFARQAEEELARAEEEARLAEEEARKEALRQKWMAEEEALAQQQGISGKPVVPGIDEKMCPNCGKILRLKSKFCNGCGMDVRNVSTTQPLPLHPPGLAEEESIREEELARQAEEELRRAEEEARRLAEEEARRDEEKLRKLEEELLKSGTKGQLQDDMNCPNCGKKLRWGAKFCNGCGTDLSFLSSDQEGSASYLPEDYKEDKKKK